MVNIVHSLSKLGHVKLSESERTRLFTHNEESSEESDQEESFNDTRTNSSLRVLVKQFLVDFINVENFKNQSEFMIELESKSSVTFSTIPQEEIILSGLIQILARSLIFIKNENILISLIKYFRRHIFSQRNENFVYCFCENSGLANYFLILNEYKDNKSIKDLILASFQK